MTLLDRVVLTSILPARGTFSDLICREDILEKIKITQDEIVEFGISEKDNKLFWQIDKTKDRTWEIDFTELERGLIKKVLTKLNTDEALEAGSVNLYRKFVTS